MRAQTPLVPPITSCVFLGVPWPHQGLTWRRLLRARCRSMSWQEVTVMKSGTRKLKKAMVKRKLVKFLWGGEGSALGWPAARWAPDTHKCGHARSQLSAALQPGAAGSPRTRLWEPGPR